MLGAGTWGDNAVVPWALSAVRRCGGVGGQGLQRDPFGTDHVIIDDLRAMKGYLED